jgi:hypothetical protein
VKSKRKTIEVLAVILLGLLFYEVLVLPLSEMALWALRNMRYRWEEQRKQEQNTPKEETPAVSGTSLVASSIEKMDPNEEYKFRGGFLESGIWNLTADIDGYGNKESIKIVQKRTEGERTSYKVTAYLLQNGEEHLIVENTGGPFSWAKILDLDNYGPKEFLFETVEGQLGYTRFYRYEDGEFIYVPLIPETGWSGFAGSGGVHLWNTGSETLVYFPVDEAGLPLRGECRGKGELYTYYDGVLVKLHNTSLAPEWCREFKG